MQVGWRCSKSQRDMLAAMHVCVRCPRKRETMNERTALFHMTVLSSDRDASDFASRHFDLGLAFHIPCRTHWISPLARDTFLGAIILTVMCTTYHLSQPFRGLPTAPSPAVSCGLYTRVALATYITVSAPELPSHLLKEPFEKVARTRPCPLAGLKRVLRCLLFFQDYACPFSRTFPEFASTYCLPGRAFRHPLFTDRPLRRNLASSALLVVISRLARFVSSTFTILIRFKWNWAEPSAACFCTAHPCRINSQVERHIL